jgi:glycosyltransferase 2 family protein
MAEVAERIQGLDGRYLVGALVLQLAILLFRTLAWRGVLAAAYPQQPIPIRSVTCSYAAGVALNAFVPARGGECVKIALARAQIPGTCVATIGASLSVVLVVDTLIGTVLLAVLWMLGSAPPLPTLPALGPSVCVAGAVAGVALIVTVAAARRVGVAVRRFLAAAVQGLAILRAPVLYAYSVLPFQLAAWTARIALVYLVLQAFHIQAGLAPAMLVVALSGLALPVPGGAGSHQVLAAYALQGAISTAGAVSFSVGLQVGITAVNTAVGLMALMLLFRTARPLAAIRAASAGAAGDGPPVR